MDKPLIGIPTRYHEPTETMGQVRHYLDAIFAAGGLPLIIPTMDSPSVVRQLIQMIDGVLLPGSSTDVDPVRYGAQPHPNIGKMYPERDALDFALLEHSENSGLPVLGICFGIQSLNVFRGGTLVQDIPAVVPNAVVHSESKHSVHLDNKSGIAEFAGGTELEVNSFHHQGIERPGRNLRVVATAPDGVIEAVEDTSGKFVVGVQWHPERGWKDSLFAQNLFAAFIQAARKSK
jgi:putative glutamine amidotransferase